MHQPHDKPACWTETVPERVIRPFWDGGRACANFRTLEDEAKALHLTPTCVGCARAQRARDLRDATA